MCHRSVLHPPSQRVALPDAARCVFLDRMAYLLSWWVPRRRRADSVSFRSLVFELEKAPGQISSAFSFGLNIQSVEFARPFPSFLSNGSISLSCSNIRPLSTLVFPQNCVTLYASCSFWLTERLHEHYFHFIKPYSHGTKTLSERQVLHAAYQGNPKRGKRLVFYCKC